MSKYPTKVLKSDPLNSEGEFCSLYESIMDYLKSESEPLSRTTDSLNVYHMNGNTITLRGTLGESIWINIIGEDSKDISSRLLEKFPKLKI